jgi:hypothetical protein
MRDGSLGGCYYTRDDTTLRGARLLPIAAEMRGLALDPILDPNAPARDETKRDERGSHLPLSH